MVRCIGPTVAKQTQVINHPPMCLAAGIRCLWFYSFWLLLSVVLHIIDKNLHFAIHPMDIDLAVFVKCSFANRRHVNIGFLGRRSFFLEILQSKPHLHSLFLIILSSTFNIYCAYWSLSIVGLGVNLFRRMFFCYADLRTDRGCAFFFTWLHLFMYLKSGMTH